MRLHDIHNVAAVDSLWRRLAAIMPLSRSISLESEGLGSEISGLSALSEGDEVKSHREPHSITDLSALSEGSSLVNQQEEQQQEQSPPPPPPPPLSQQEPQSNRNEGHSTPRASTSNLSQPTDTVIANNVREIEVPGTFAKQFRRDHRDSPKDDSMLDNTPVPSRFSKGLTLKEHRSTVERLGKENFDLKMKIHFLDQALQKRSEEGVKEMITENVQLKSDNLRLERDNNALRKQVRDLERLAKQADSPSADQGYGTDDERSPTAEEEVDYLRDRLENCEIELEKLRSENLTKESEKRKLAEMVKSLGEPRSTETETGSKEERDMWKDMLKDETAAREQSEDANKKLREEVSKLKVDMLETTAAGQAKSGRLPPSVTQSSSSEVDTNENAKPPESLVEFERLQHENSELQKTVSAQVSTLTSRNKEKERLYQEIEELKLGRLGGGAGGSVADDSIFERSASRIRSNSRASDTTRASRVSEEEREAFEIRIGDLRDQVSELRLENQSLKTQLDQVWINMESLEHEANAEIDNYKEELDLLTSEREDFAQRLAEREEDYHKLKSDAQEELDGMGDELDQKTEESARLEDELRAQEESFKALQDELRSASEGIVRLEEDAQSNLTRYQTVKSELDDANRELQNLEKSLAESSSKVQRLTVQQESSRNEIAFLREEQDGDKIKIGDMEAVLKATHLSLSTEKDRSRDLERRLSEERRQHEAVGSKEQEGQRVVNDLNREITATKEEIRRLKKALSTREIESTTWRERLMELESNLREVLGDPNGTRSSLLTSVTKLQKDLDATAGELDMMRERLDEKENLLTNRDSLLESSGLEYRKVTELLERERQGRRADKHSFEQALKSHAASAKTISQNNSRIAELENGRQADRRRMNQLDQQYKDQLNERNGVLLTIWKRLSAICGPDWAHSNSLINGNLPSQEVIGNMLFWPGFSKNLMLAAKQVEGVLGSYRDRIKRIERDLWKEYQSLEHTVDLRIKKLERVEELFNNVKMSQVTNIRTGSGSSGSTDAHKLKGQNRILKAELALLQQQQHGNTQHGSQSSRPQSRVSVGSEAPSVGGNAVPARGSSSRRSGAAAASAALTASLMRHHTTNVVEHVGSGVNGAENGGGSRRSDSVSSRLSHQRGGDYAMTSYPHSNEGVASPTGGEEKWIHRLRELERRLKAEREARLLDRSGARKRLEERDAVNQELRSALEAQQKLRAGSVVSTAEYGPESEDEYQRGEVV